MTRTIEQQDPFGEPPSIFPGGNPNPPPSGPTSAPTQGGFAFPFSNGGVLALNQAMVISMVNPNSGIPGFFSFNPDLGFDDKNDGSSYSYRVEEIQPGLVVTVRRLFVSYTDLGRVTLTFTIDGSFDDGAPFSNSITKTLGNSIPTGRILTTPIDLAFSCLNPQLTITRAKGAGPMSITKVIMIIEVPESTR